MLNYYAATLISVTEENKDTLLAEGKLTLLPFIIVEY